MIQITVSDDDARLITGASAPIVVVDSQGRPLGQISPIKSRVAVSDEDGAEIQRRMKTPGPGFTTQEVIDYLHSLDT